MAKTARASTTEAPRKRRQRTYVAVAVVCFVEGLVTVFGGVGGLVTLLPPVMGVIVAVEYVRRPWGLILAGVGSVSFLLAGTLAYMPRTPFPG
ncbi:MAG: hypothetical protein ACXVD8_09695 [Actinomycetota bacterium]